MKTQILQLDPHDDVVSVRDKMTWAQAQRLVLVWPARGQVLQRQVDLILLHRQAHQLGAHLSLVTHDPLVREHAAALGVPVFARVDHTRRLRWRSRLPRLAPLRRRPPPDLAVIRAARSQAALAPSARSWWWRAPVTAVALVALLALAVTVVPSAQVRLRPNVVPVETSIAVTADPVQAEVDTALAVIPARPLQVEVQRNSFIATTGTREAPAVAASGRAVFTNITGQPATIPAGTGLRTTSGNSVRFETARAVAIAARIGATVDVEIRALDLGPAGNVAAGQINAIDGAIGLQLAVTNPAATAGGATAQRVAVAPADRSALREQLEASLLAEARDALNAQLQPGEFLPPETVQRVRVVSENFDHAVGEPADALGLTLRLAVTALAIHEDDARLIGQAAFGAAVPTGYRTDLEAVRFSRSRETVFADGRATFTLRLSGEASPVIDVDAVRNRLAGQTLRVAEQDLQATLDLAQPPEIVTQPDFFAPIWPRLPWLPLRIEVVVDDG